MPFVHSSTSVVGLALVVVFAFATAGVTADVVTASDGALALDAEAYSATRGAVVPVVVSLDGTSSARLTLVERTGAYVATATVVDADGDGQIRVAFDTFAAGRGDERQSYRAAAGDAVVDVTRLTSARTTPIPAGTYAVVATTADARADATLTLSPFAFGPTAVETAPRGVSPFPETPDEAETHHETDVVATGDWVVLRFDAPGLSGLVEADAVPVSNLVYADPSTPKARSTHTVRVPVVSDEPLRRLVVDYDGEDGDRPRNLTVGAAVTLVGVDRDGDGTVDVDLDESLVSVTTHSDGRYRFQFDGQYRLAPGDGLVVRYALVNPDTTGRDRVTVGVNDAPSTAGTVTYGLAGRGTLGNGATLDLVRTVDGETLPVSLATAEYGIDAEAGVLTVAFPAPSLVEGRGAAEYTATLSLTPDSPYAGDVGDDRAVASYVVVPRTASVDGVVDGTLSVESGRQPLAGTASVAPGSRIVVYAARYDEPGSFIQARLATVDADGSWTADFDFRDVDPGTRFELTVYDLERGGLTPSAELTVEPVDVVVRADDREP
ncbi:hypothetical protein SAMN04487948_12346 [Halogranum amylolyticum]|uniref:DUF7827 domain-containing protein n=1 Tax=Halogranum amylolyticum TaxID=660520 RepID=A0A1H8W5D4_9EURY|nr:BGTF surface domain-containing protein [Halogranum amylolyticum]SEP22733.1 hypothetical protein SAMN04487948_12346 [Halogranum amylolyticum]